MESIPEYALLDSHVLSAHVSKALQLYAQAFQRALRFLAELLPCLPTDPSISY